MLRAYGETLSRWMVRVLIPTRAEPLWRAVAFGLACGAAAIVIRLPLGLFIVGGLPFMLSFPAITAAAARGGMAGAGSATAVTVVYYVMTQPAPHGSPIGRLLTLIMFLASAGAVSLVARELRRTVDRLRAQEQRLTASEAHARLLVREMEHRVKNSLSLASALAKLTQRHSVDLADFRERFEPRLRALAQAQTALTRSDWGDPGLRPLLEEVLEPFRDPGGAALVIEPGPDFAVPQALAVSLCLILHELATNAVKHGALSAPMGRVSVGWSLNAGGDVARIAWVEAGGPKITRDGRNGFGSELFRILNRGDLSISRSLEPGGAVCSIEVGKGLAS